MTEPHEQLITIHDPSTPLGSTLSDLANGVREAHSFGTHLFTWCNEATSERKDDVAPLLMLFRHSLEVMDAIPPLLAAGIIVPCSLLQRSLLESVMSVEYLVAGDSRRRGYAYLVCEIHRRLNIIDMADPETNPGRQAKRAFESDKTLEYFVPPIFDDLDQRREPLLELLTLDGYREAESEYQRLKRKRNTKPKWHAFYGGPQSVWDLANQVKMAGLYQIFYRSWSGVAHGSDILEGRMIFTKGNPSILALRQPLRAQEVTSLSLSMAIHLFQIMGRELAPLRSNDCRTWYLREMKPLYNRVSSKEQIIKVDWGGDA